jgi:hypothetical protein
VYYFLLKRISLNKCTLSSSDISIVRPNLMFLCEQPIGRRFELIQKVYFKIRKKII